MSARVFKSKMLLWTLMTMFWTVCVVTPVYADIITTEQIASAEELQMQQDALKEQLLKDDVRKEMIAMGIDPTMVEERISNLTAAEIAQIQGQLDELPAGAGLGAVLTVLLILILLEITGLIDIFPRI